MNPLSLNACRICLGISTGSLLISFFMFIWAYVYHKNILGPELGANILVIISFSCNIAIIVISKFGNSIKTPPPEPFLA